MAASMAVGDLLPREGLVSVEVRRLVEILVITVEYRSGGRSGRRHDPGPVRWAGTALLFFAFQVLQKADRLGVMIGDGDPGGAERMQYGEVEFGHRLVFPQGPVARRRQAHMPGDHR